MVSSHYSLVYISDAACPGYWIQHEVWCGHSMNPAWARACLMSSAGYRVTSPLLKVQHGVVTGLTSTSWKTRRSHLIQLKSSIATPLWVSDIQKTCCKYSTISLLFFLNEVHYYFFLGLQVGLPALITYHPWCCSVTVLLLWSWGYSSNPAEKIGEREEQSKNGRTKGKNERELVQRLFLSMIPFWR